MAPIHTKPPRAPTTVNDYTILPLSIPSTPSFPKQTTHYLYLRPNAPKTPTPTTARELFLINLPIDATPSHLRSLFSTHFGGARIESIAFEGARTGQGKKLTAPVTSKAGRKRKRGADSGEGEVVALPEVWDREVGKSGGTAVVVFVDTASAEVAMKEVKRAVRDRRSVVWGEGVKGVPELGSARYLAHHSLSYPDKNTLQHSVDAFMVSFAAQEATRAKALARLRAVPDEDGFVTVTRGGRVGPARQEEAAEKAEKQKEKQTGKEDFYRFQMREKRKERAGELLRGFEEDKRRVEEMKKRRNKFKPH